MLDERRGQRGRDVLDYLEGGEEEDGCWLGAIFVVVVFVWDGDVGGGEFEFLLFIHSLVFSF